MKTVTLKLNSGSHDVIVGPGLLAESGYHLKGLGLKGKLAIITDATVRKLYANALKQTLLASGFEVTILNGPDSEEEKSLETAGRLYLELTDMHAERSTPVLAVGGGVIGDLAGFVAATYQRGVPLVQIPTTLLAQADSSLGGKTAVNHGSLKNRIGVFYQPRLTISDTNTLKSLTKEQLSEGLCEIIKHGAIRDGELFDYIESNLDRIMDCDDEALETIVHRSVKIKAEVVEQDEFDLGLRNILNYGHTVGHAVETVSDFQVPHGRAVAIGMVVAAEISNRMGLLNKNDVARIEELLTQAGLLGKVPKIERDRLIEAMHHDKKIVGGKIRFVLLKTIGEVTVTDDVSLDLVEKVLSEKL
ncbi:MAG TPA: 3-dehydroquinate synthase [Dehalococcoidia bacterium]|nr:3-dehydroquinate synthase [Dehalococcoidia bacterium]